MFSKWFSESTKRFYDNVFMGEYNLWKLMQRPVYEWLCLCSASRMLLTEILITIILNKIQYMVKHFCKILWHVLNRHVTLSVNKIWSVLKADVTLLERFSPAIIIGWRRECRNAEQGRGEELIWKAISRGFAKTPTSRHPTSAPRGPHVMHLVPHLLQCFLWRACGRLCHPSMTVALRTPSSERAEP